MIHNWINFIQHKEWKDKIITRTKRQFFCNQMQKLKQQKKDSWVFVHWARNRAQSIHHKRIFSILKQRSKEACTIEKKIELLWKVHFSSSSKIDLSNILNMKYSKSLQTEKKISYDEIKQAVLQADKDKASELNKILNRIMYIIVQQRSELLQKLF